MTGKLQLATEKIARLHYLHCLYIARLRQIGRCGNEVRPNNDSKIRSMLEGAMPTAGTKDSWRKDLGTWQQNRTQVTLLASDELARKVDINAQSCTIK
ncbi:hypothetical protein LENED_004740 [Lentinula edodes]|uniref:Uncharacterized protein n=1 Tax=Lentinula edodes TaxID=5353 RepID=A0A1Q3E7A0_LENED|nr:hypothetical protein LENED_004740 [Lentinula edodes]